ncbi:MAG: cupredoxin domain-containing protein [Nanoarchaeota archaeon]
MKIKWIFSLLLVLSVLVVGCAKSTNETTLTGQAVSQIETIKTFEITAKSFSFEPDTITVNKGDKVKLIVTSIDIDHGVGIKEYNLRQYVAAGKTETIEFIADKQGTFNFYCSVYCGEGHGTMKGQLIVK